MDHKKIFFLNVLEINFFQIFIGTHYILIILFFPTLHFYLYFFFFFGRIYLYFCCLHYPFSIVFYHSFKSALWCREKDTTSKCVKKTWPQTCLKLYFFSWWLKISSMCLEPGLPLCQLGNFLKPPSGCGAPKF